MSAKRSRRRSCAHRGMTLVEVMVVIAIMGVVAALVGTFAYRSKIIAERRAASVQINQLVSAVEQFMLSYHNYPTGDLEILTKPPRSALPIVRKIPKDPWGNAYIYVNPGVHNVGWFDLSSHGPDGLPDTEDDINNWTEFVE